MTLLGSLDIRGSLLVRLHSRAHIPHVVSVDAAESEFTE